MRKITSREKIFSHGYFCACATMLRQHGESSIVEDCVRENFMDIETMRKIGVDEFDIEVLEPIVKEIERRRNL
jgi:hypothetical protein